MRDATEAAALRSEDRDFVVAIRRDLHRHPETAFEEHRTASLIASALQDAGLEVRRGVARTGVVGVLRGAAPGPTMLIRADMDALPVQEVAGRAYGSQVAGKMHACGHDGHVAMALTAARVLARQRVDIPGNVVFAFQPAEETTGGAALMIADGALADPKVDAAIGVHLANTLLVGQVAASPGPVSAATDGFSLTVTGKGGHAARPHLSVDPVAISFQVGAALHLLMTRERSPAQPAVLTIGSIHGGTAGNVIADEVVMKGTLRTYDAELRARLKQRIEEVAGGTASTLRGDARVVWEEGYPPTVNDRAITALVNRVAAGVVGESGLVEHEASFGGDDMAYFCAAVPGCYFRLGSANPAVGLTNPPHSARFDFDEAALPLGAQLLAATALAFVAGEAAHG
jgi:amidohydrolase